MSTTDDLVPTAKVLIVVLASIVATVACVDVELGGNALTGITLIAYAIFMLAFVRVWR